MLRYCPDQKYKSFIYHRLKYYIQFNMSATVINNKKKTILIQFKDEQSHAQPRAKALHP